MDWLTFIAELAKAAAWPLAVVAIALMFRPQLRALLERLQRGRIGPAEFEFERRLKGLATQAAGRQAAATAAMPLPDGPARDVIGAAWRELARAAPTDLQQLDARDQALYRQLDALREQAQAASDFKPSRESVGAYVQLARSLQARMARAR